MRSNKKIKNATPVTYNGINFKSRTEKSIYILLESHGFAPQYEPEKITIWEGFKPTIDFYKDNKKDMKKIISITYTPDFIFTYANKKIYLEVKGYENDTYGIKRKLFRKYLETKRDCLFFEIHSVRAATEMINLLHNYDTI